MSSNKVQIVGILNITDDSFSDGGEFLDPEVAKNKALELFEQHADIIDVGAAASSPIAKDVSTQQEIKRLDGVINFLQYKKIPISIDTFNPEVQIYALQKRVDYINDITGFCHPEIYDQLAQSESKLVLMHSVQKVGKANYMNTQADTVLDAIKSYFEIRINKLTQAGVAEDRIILDPGMGFFLGTDPLVSIKVLQSIEDLKKSFNLPLYISVSRKSFVRNLLNTQAKQSSIGTVVAELYSCLHGADFIRTHEPQNISYALKIWNILQTCEK